MSEVDNSYKTVDDKKGEQCEEIKFGGKRKKKRRIIIAVVLVIGCAAALAIGLSIHYRCAWTDPGEKGAPWCSYRSSNTGYDVIRKESLSNGLLGDLQTNTTGERLHLRRRAGLQHVYGMKIYDHVVLDIEFYTNSAVRLKFYPENETYFEIPREALDITANGPVDASQLEYELRIIDNPFELRIIRKASGTTVFHITPTGLVFSAQYHQLTTRLPTGNLYGFGEHNHRQFRHDMRWRTWSIFTRDLGPRDNDRNLYGAQPTYMNLEEDGQANIVLLKNSNGMEVALQPDPMPSVTYRVIGGIPDFYVFLAPNPEQAVQQYTQAIGRSMMPPYWSLGFHLCRWGYANLSVIQETVRRTQLAEIPQDVQWGDIDHMFEKLDFTVNKATYAGLDSFVDELHDQGMKFVVINDPGIGKDPDQVKRAARNSPGYNMYQDGVTADVYVKDRNGKILDGKVWPGRVSYPDFTNPAKLVPWFSKWISYFMNYEGVNIDGLWVDMNEVSSFVPGMYLTHNTTGCVKNHWNNPPYAPDIEGRNGLQRRMYDKTICMDAQLNWGRHYDTHSLYGHAMSMVANRAMTSILKKRPFIMTRSNFVGTSKWSAHWLGDNDSTWPQLAWSIVGILEYSIFGFPLNGADICGFWGQAEYEMCLRWQQLGAFYPFSRNHNAHNDHVPEFTPQDPAAWNETLINSSRAALLTRYKLLPFLYTLVHKAHISGTTVARPLMFDFPRDKEAISVDRQFLWGSALLISPVLEKGKRTVRAYFPNARWFDYYTGMEVAVSPAWHTLDAPLETINLHLRGGYILPWQAPANTTVYSRRKPMGLIVALDRSGKADGSLFWDDGESLDTYENGQYLEISFSMLQAGELKLSVVHTNYPGAGALQFTTLEIYGLANPLTNLTVDGITIDQGHIQARGKIVLVDGLHMGITTNHTITWDDS